MVKRRNNVAKRLAKVEAVLKKDKPEVKSLDVMINPLADEQNIYSDGIWNGTALIAYDLTDGFLQGLQNTGGNIDGNYCKLTSMDLRVLLTTKAGDGTAQPHLHKIRMMIVRVPAGDTLSPSDIQGQVLEYGHPATYGELANVSPLKRNSTINGGYDVMYDRVHLLSATTTNPQRGYKKVHFRKKWTKGLTLRFSGVAGTLTLEQNRIYLFAMDTMNGTQAAPHAAAESYISFINRVRYSDE